MKKMFESHSGTFFKFLLLAAITTELTGCKPEAESRSQMLRTLCRNKIATLADNIGGLETGQLDVNSGITLRTLSEQYFQLINSSACLDGFGSAEKIDEELTRYYETNVKHRKAFQKFKEGIEILTEK